MRLAPFFIIFLFGFWALTGCDNYAVQPKPSGKTVKVGVIGPFSGPDTAWGENGLAGIKAALLFQPLLDNGDRVEVVLEDDRNQPHLATKALDRLVMDEKVAAVLAMSGSTSVLSLASKADSYKTPILALTSTHPDITDENSYISQLLFDDEFQASVAALFSRDELLVERVGVVKDDQNPHSMYLAEEFAAKFVSVGGVATAIPLTEDKEEMAKRLQYLQLQGVELLYIPLDAVHVLTIAKLLGTLAWKPVLMGGDGLQATIVLQHKDSLHLVNGMLAIDPHSSLQPTADYGEKIIKIFLKQSKTEGTVIAALGAEGTSILVAAMNLCQDSGDRACINNELRTTVDFTGMFGKISIKSDGKAERPVYLNKIENRKLRLVVKVY